MARSKCPKCGGKLVDIVYGMPGPELFAKAECGKVHLGGCCLSGNDPAYHCNKCDREFYGDLTEAELLEMEEDE